MYYLSYKISSHWNGEYCTEQPDTINYYFGLGGVGLEWKYDGVLSKQLQAALDYYI